MIALEEPTEHTIATFDLTDSEMAGNSMTQNDLDVMIQR
jgi:hypothetical protein